MKKTIYSLSLTAFLNLHAATFVVDTTTFADADPATTTLADAIQAAEANNEADTITFAAALQNATIPFTATLPAIASLHGITITGFDNGATLTLDGRELFSLFHINADASLTLEHLTLINGETSDGTGGAIDNRGTCALRHCTLSANHSYGGGPEPLGGAVHSTGTLTAHDSRFTENTCNFGGAAVALDGGSFTASNCLFHANDTTYGYGRGGAINVDNATLLTTDCAFTHNRADDLDFLAAGRGGAVRLERGSSFTAERCLFAHNRANNGGAVYITSSTLIARQCTFFDNHAVEFGENSSDGAGAIANFGSATLEHCTLVRNRAEDLAGGIYNSFDKSLTLNNCLVAGNTAVGNPSDIDNDGGTVTLNGGWIGLQGYTIDQLVSTNLANHGGATDTLGLPFLSPLIDAGDSALADGYPLDQRGQQRILGGGLDIGAFEATPLAIQSAGTQVSLSWPSLDGVPYTLQQTATFEDGQFKNWSSAANHTGDGSTATLNRAATLNLNYYRLLEGSAD